MFLNSLVLSLQYKDADMQVTKYILPVVAGIMAAMMLIKLGETAIIKMYMPAGINQNDLAAISGVVKQLPLSAFLFLLVNYIVCSFLGGIVSTLISKRETVRPVLVVGIVLTLAGLYNVVSIEHPMWFTIISLFIYLPFSYFGYWTVRKKEPIFTGNNHDETPY